MTTRAYVLITADVGKAEQVVGQLRAISGVRLADVVTGSYDVVAVLEGPDANALGRLVMAQIHGVPGVKTTQTLLALS